MRIKFNGFHSNSNGIYKLQSGQWYYTKTIIKSWNRCNISWFPFVYHINLFSFGVNICTLMYIHMFKWLHSAWVQVIVHIKDSDFFFFFFEGKDSDFYKLARTTFVTASHLHHRTAKYYVIRLIEKKKKKKLDNEGNHKKLWMNSTLKC